jgi:hypothetical protein
MSAKIIGTGLSPLGAVSARTALRKLGFGPCHRMMKRIADPARVAARTAVARGETAGMWTSSGRPG